ncbi:HD domain-containing protein [Pseudorhodoplanes sp.]|uniref:HD domain-containing protein n=1 Tax=Pseudorhodoplanes sp. TaxID=1934341 RepID=UPI003D13450E
MSNATALTERFDRALLYATHVHGGQVRKGTSTPYVAHLLAVGATVLEYGGSEDMAIAGLLHDAVEDQGGEPRLADIRNRFGDGVADIVLACSDSASANQPKGGMAGSQATLHRPPRQGRRGNAAGVAVGQNP